LTDAAELAAWLRLMETPRVGRAAARRLLTRFGSPQAVFEAPSADWHEVAGAATASELAHAPEHLAPLLSTTLQWLDEATEAAPRTVLTLGDPAYPVALLHAADPPLLLYLQGDVTRLAATSVAMVGSRRPTPAGLDTARRFAAEFSAAGLTVVSGLAQGIDGAAHAGALDGPGGTIAVVGTGLDRVYPRQHRQLAHRIACQGLLLSEYALGSGPLAAHFPQRNRIIAGLTRCTVVVEAALKSGSLITARLALDAGRDVMAVPGSIRSDQSQGCHALIQQGAMLAQSAQDVMDELGWAHAPQVVARSAAVPPLADPVLQALSHDACTLDTLLARTGWDTAPLTARLLELELTGQVARLPGQAFQRISAD
jgi:DNA processing protein